MKNKFLFLVLAFVLVLLIVGQAAVKKANQNVYLASDVVHQGNYYVAGTVIDIAGTVNGDVFAVGNSITVSGMVNGDVFAAASNIRISGQVDGNVRVAGSNVSVEGKISRSLMAAGSNVFIGENAEIGRQAAMAGAVIDARGKIGGNLEAAGNMITVANEVGGNGYIRLDENSNLNFVGRGKITGDLDYTAKEAMNFSSNQVGGQTNFHQLTFKKEKKLLTGAYVFGKIINLFGFLIIGLIFISLAPKKVKNVCDLMLNKPLLQIGRGVIWFFLTPLVCVLLLITIIGIPLAVILGMVYAIMLYLGKVFAALAVGLWLAKIFKWQKVTLLLALIIGVIIFSLIKGIPFLGWLIGLVAIWWAWCTIIQIKKESWE